MSRPSWIQILFMIRITCRVSISCRRSSPDWTEISQSSGGLWTHCWEQTGERFYLEDDVDVVSSRVEVLEGQFERNRIGVKEGTWLQKTEREGDFITSQSPNWGQCEHTHSTHMLRWFSVMMSPSLISSPQKREDVWYQSNPERFDYSSFSTLSEDTAGLHVD